MILNLSDINTRFFKGDDVFESFIGVGLDKPIYWIDRRNYGLFKKSFLGITNHLKVVNKNISAITNLTPEGRPYYSKAEIQEQSYLNDLKLGKIYLVADFSDECFYKDIDDLYTHIILQHNIDPTNIIVIISSKQLKVYADDLSKKYGLLKVKIIHYNYFESRLRRLMKEQFPKGILSPNFKQIKKRFMFLNNTAKLERYAILLMLHSNNLLEKGHISFLDKGNYESRTISPEHLRTTKILYYTTILKNVYEKLNIPYFDSSVVDDIVARIPFTLDPNIHYSSSRVQNLYYFTAWSHDPKLETICRYYAQSFFVINTESLFFNSNPTFITEKTFKCIAFKKPFITISTPLFLKQLKELGYQTFSEIIDESYDEEIDDTKRLLKCFQEIKRLCLLPDQEIKNMLDKINLITEYNYNHFVNNKKTFTIET